MVKWLTLCQLQLDPLRFPRYVSWYTTPMPIEPAQPNKDDKPKDDAELQRMLAEYKRALEQEFDVVERPEIVDPTLLAEAVKKQMITHLPKAFATIVYLTEHGESHAIRLTAAKYIVESAIGKNAIAINPADPLSTIMSKLRKVPHGHPDSDRDENGYPRGNEDAGR